MHKIEYLHSADLNSYIKESQICISKVKNINSQSKVIQISQGFHKIILVSYERTELGALHRPGLGSPTPGVMGQKSCMKIRQIFAR